MLCKTGLSKGEVWGPCGSRTLAKGPPRRMKGCFPTLPAIPLFTGKAERTDKVAVGNRLRGWPRYDKVRYDNLEQCGFLWMKNKIPF